MGRCRRVIGSTEDGRHLVICNKDAPCPDHFPRNESGARFWPSGARPGRYVPLVDLPQISDEDWELWASVKAQYPDVLIPSPKEARECGP